MQLPQIRINSQNARIGLDIQNAQLRLESQEADVQIQQPKADINIRTRPGRLTIDQSQAFADLGQFPVAESMRRSAAEGMQKAAQGSQRRRRQGDQLMKIEQGGDQIASIAKQNAPRQVRPFNIGFIPSHFSVKIDYEPAEVEINNVVNKPIIEARPNPVIHDYQAGAVDVYLEQKNWLDVDFPNLKFIGNQFEMMI
ncbi:hypothetical protein SAMN04488134_10990 [Amphibacillus marinus]|uniref:YviE n=1 Tax=Amphibacillus marinus TaxID=872970 RepID=A0A1H8QXW2_9BACI|nr:DUF6470 family protein [Amphibacillus marinus]SEO59180.1 hypothetical protein SAMN04488134_10990 [Amphibacillus marinus]